MTQDERYILKCIELARLGSGKVAPNPMVGAVIVHNDQIIGEGYHQQYGGPHAEVNAVNSVKDQSLLADSTIYVSLEPCAHFGKTPPCADLIIRHRFKKVVIGSHDPFDQVDGKGIQRIKEAGIEVEIPILHEACRDLNKRFFTFHEKKRPYIILKWAQTTDGFLDRDRSSTDAMGINWITQPNTKKLVHQWRSEESAILVGKNTVHNDNPLLTTRAFNGKNPVRVIIDPSAQIDNQYQVLNSDAKTIILNLVKDAVDEINDNIWIKLEQLSPSEICHRLHALNIQSLFIEGGAFTLQAFIDSGLWDEARIITGTVAFENGLSSPTLPVKPSASTHFGEDLVEYYANIQD